MSLYLDVTRDRWRVLGLSVSFYLFECLADWASRGWHGAFLQMPFETPLDKIFGVAWPLLHLLWGIAVVVLWKRVKNWPHQGWKRVQIICLILTIVMSFWFTPGAAYVWNAATVMLTLPAYLIAVHMLFVIPVWIRDGFHKETASGTDVSRDP